MVTRFELFQCLLVKGDTNYGVWCLNSPTVIAIVRIEIQIAISIKIGQPIVIMIGRGL